MNSDDKYKKVKIVAKNNNIISDYWSFFLKNFDNEKYNLRNKFFLLKLVNENLEINTVLMCEFLKINFDTFWNLLQELKKNEAIDFANNKTEILLVILDLDKISNVAFMTEKKQKIKKMKEMKSEDYYEYLYNQQLKNNFKNLIESAVIKINSFSVVNLILDYVYLKNNKIFNKNYFEKIVDNFKENNILEFDQAYSWIKNFSSISFSNKNFINKKRETAIEESEKISFVAQLNEKN